MSKGYEDGIPLLRKPGEHLPQSVLTLLILNLDTDLVRNAIFRVTLS